MNNIYKVIWSKAKNCYVVASEIARSHTKSASGSTEKIGEVTRRSLLALGAACAIVCGGFVNVGASVQSETISAGGTTSNPVLTVDNTDDAAQLNKVISAAKEDKLLTKDNLSGQLTDYAKTSDVTEVKDAAKTLSDKIDNADTGLNSKASTSLDNLTEPGSNKIKELAKASVSSDLAGKTNQDMDNLSETGSNKIKELAKSAVDLTDFAKTEAVNESLENKADKNLGNIDADGEAKIKNVMKDSLDAKANATDLKDYAKKDASNIDKSAYTEALGTGTVTESNTGLVTGGIVDAAIKSAVKAEKDAREEAEKKLGDRVTSVEQATKNISYDAVTGTVITGATTINGVKVGDQVDMGGKNITNAGTINGIEIGDAQVDMKGKNITGAGTINGIDIGDVNVNLKEKKLTNVDTINGVDADDLGTKTEIAAEATIRKNADDALDKRIGKVDTDGTYIKASSDTNTIAKNLEYLDKGIGAKTDGEYVKNTKTVNDNLKALDDQVKTNTGNITKNTEDIAKLDKSSVKYDNDVKDKITLGGVGGTTITNLKDAALSDSSTDAVTGKQLNKTNEDLKTEVKAREDADKALSERTTKLEENTGGIKRNTEDTKTTIEGKVTVDNEGNISNVKDLNTKTITTTGKAEIGGKLTVKGDLVTEKSITNKKDENNYTKIDGGHVTSKNLEVNGAGQSISSSSTFNAEENKIGFANNATGDQSFHKQDESGFMDNVKDNDNSNNRTQTKTETKDTITDKDENSSTTSQTASENKTYLEDKGKKNTNTTVDTAKDYNKTIQGEHGKTSTSQDELNITNTAEAGTITNDAQDIVNSASGNISNSSATMDTTVTGEAKESYGKLTTTVENDESHTVKGNQTNEVGGDQTNTIKGNQTTTVTGDISNSATNITNSASDNLTDKVGENTRVIDQTSISDTVGNANRKMADGQIDDTIQGVSGNGSSFRQRIDAIMGNVKSADGESEVIQNGNQITSVVGKGETTNSKVTQTKDMLQTALTDGTNYNVSQDAANASAKLLTDGTKINKTLDNLDSSERKLTNGTYETSSLQTALNITNTAKDGTIKNDAKDIENIASGNIKNSSATMDTTVTGKATESYGELETTVTGDEKHNVNGNQTNIIGGNQKTTVTGDISNSANNITNEASEKLTDRVGDNTRVLDKDGITDTVGNTSFKQRINDIMMEAKNGTITSDAKNIVNKAAETITNDAVNITNNATGTISSNASEIKNKADKLISSKVGENTYQNIEDGKITESIKNGTKQNLTQSDADGTNHFVVDGKKSSVTKQTSEEITGAVSNGSSSNVTQNTATSSNNTIADLDAAGKPTKANSVISTVDGTTFVNSAATTPVTGASGDGTATNTTIKGNTITTGKVTMDYADVMKDLGVKGNTTLGEAGKDTILTVNSKATFNEKATFEKGAEVKKGLTVSSGGMNVTGESTFHDKVTMEKGLDVTGGVSSDSFTVKGTDIKIDSSGINAGGKVISNVADGSISEGSKDAVNGGQLYQVKNDLEGKVNKVGANAAAMANLHPMEFDPDSKWNIAAAMGNYGSETATAMGLFYRPNEDVMVNLSTAFGTGENMVGGGVSVRLGQGGNKATRKENSELKAKVDDLTARMDALLSVLNPNMSKDFPDVPENHWAYEAVSRLAGNDIIQGYPDGEFHGDRTMTRYEMAEIIYNALSRGASAEKKLVEEFKPELQALAASNKATADAPAEN